MRFEYRIENPEEARLVLSRLWKGAIEPHARKGAAAVISWETWNDHRRHGWRKYFHGILLPAAALQVYLFDPLTGRRIRYAPKVWKEHLKSLFMLPEFEELPDPETGEIRVRESAKSFENLTDEEMADFVHRCEAYLVGELDVVIEEGRR